MPKTKIYEKFVKPRGKGLQHFFADWRQCNGLSYQDIALKTGKSESTVKHHLTRLDDEWKVSEIKTYCAVMGVPIADALSTIK